MKPLITLFLLFSSFSLFSQGLQIKGNETLIDERSSYRVFDKVSPKFKQFLNIEFDIMPTKIKSRGNILRIKNKNSKTVFCISYNGEGNFSDFNLNIEGREILISHKLNKNILNENKWIKVKLNFDFHNSSVSFQVDTLYNSSIIQEKATDWIPDMYFGKSDHVIDIPQFRISNLIVNDKEKQYYFPLNESEGENVHNSNKKTIGYVSNPVWLINNSYYWDEVFSCSSDKVAGATFNNTTHEVYYFNEDSLIIYNTRTRKTYNHKYSNTCPISMRLGTNFLDSKNNQLYVYEVADPPIGTTMMARLDLLTYSWTTITDEALPIQLHHHSGYFDNEMRTYTIFGGFGRTSYSDAFYLYDININRWKKMDLKGDHITPRYFTSMGFNNNDDNLYIFGGMGNEAGDQTIGRIYYYELYKSNITDNKINKLWSIPWKGENVVPARNLIFLNDSCFYVLCYPEHFSNSFLKLYEFKISNGDCKLYGDSIPVISEKITTNVNLHYDDQSSQFVTLVQEFKNNDISSTLKIFTLTSPPVNYSALTIYKNTKRDNFILITLILVFSSLILLFIILQKRKINLKQKVLGVLKDFNYSDKEKYTKVKQPNSIFLFGDFSVIDKNGREINYMLSTKLKQAFFLIIFYSLQDKRLSSQELSEHLWPNKSYEKSKNSRGVVLNNLRKILGELDGISLIYENGSYKLVYSDNCYCDYLRCFTITEGNHLKDMPEFVTIVSRGKFLKEEDISSFDSVKEYFENRIESTSYFYLEKAYNSGDFETVIALCDSIFLFDPLDENALNYMIKALFKLNLKDEAKQRYYLFVVEYKKIIGEDYSKSFADLSR